jgi:hypothetical protein
MRNPHPTDQDAKSASARSGCRIRICQARTLLQWAQSENNCKAVEKVYSCFGFWIPIAILSRLLRSFLGRPVAIFCDFYWQTCRNFLRFFLEDLSHFFAIFFGRPVAFFCDFFGRPVAIFLRFFFKKYSQLCSCAFVSFPNAPFPALQRRHYPD